MERRILLPLLLAVLFINPGLCFATKVQSNGKQYLPYVQVGATRFFKVNAASSSLSYDLFMPVWQLPQHLAFTDLRLYDRTGKPLEWNLHLGYRHLPSNKQQMYGIYTAFDRKRTNLGNYFTQLTFGGECWLGRLFLGGNFYQPIGTTAKPLNTTTSADFKNISGNLYNVWITQNGFYEKAMGGVDAELGYEVIQGLVGYAGGYFFRNNATETIYGPKVKLVYDWSLKNGKRIAGLFDKLGLETGIQNDAPRGTTWYVSANFKIGLLPNNQAPLQGVARHMTDLVRRDVDIISTTTVQHVPHTLKEPNGEDLIVSVINDDPREIEEELNAIDGPNVVLVKTKNTHLELTVNNNKTHRNMRTLVFSDHLNIISTTGEAYSVQVKQATSNKSTSLLQQQLRKHKQGSVVDINNIHELRTQITKKNISTPKKQIVPPVATQPAASQPEQINNDQQNSTYSTRRKMLFQEFLTSESHSDISSNTNDHMILESESAIPTLPEETVATKQSDAPIKKLPLYKPVITQKPGANIQTLPKYKPIATQKPGANITTLPVYQPITTQKPGVISTLPKYRAVTTQKPGASIKKLLVYKPITTQKPGANIKVLPKYQAVVTKKPNITQGENLSTDAQSARRKEQPQELSTTETSKEPETTPYANTETQKFIATMLLTSAKNKAISLLNSVTTNLPHPTILSGYKDFKTFIYRDVPILGGLGTLTAGTMYYLHTIMKTKPLSYNNPPEII